MAFFLVSGALSLQTKNTIFNLNHGIFINTSLRIMMR
jgi:hypothetical protein